MDNNSNILKQAKQDVFNALEGIIKSYNMRGISYSALKKYYGKKKNFEDILEDIKNKSINLFDDDSQYKKFVKEVLMDMLNDRIAYEKDKPKINEMKRISTFTNFTPIKKYLNMKHLKIYEDYNLPNGSKVYTKGAPTTILASKSDKMQKFLTANNINTIGKTFDIIQQTYHQFLRDNPEIEGVWGEKSTNPHAWWMKGY